MQRCCLEVGLKLFCITPWHSSLLQSFLHAGEPSRSNGNDKKTKCWEHVSVTIWFITRISFMEQKRDFGVKRRWNEGGLRGNCGELIKAKNYFTPVRRNMGKFYLDRDLFHRPTKYLISLHSRQSQHYNFPCVCFDFRQISKRTSTGRTRSGGVTW